MAVDTVCVWLIRARLPAATVTALAGLLDEDEQRRADALAAHQSRRFVVAHGATRLIVGRCLDAPPTELRWQRGPHGKPSLAGRWTGVEVNLSHSGEMAMLAVTGRRPVGVDVQEDRPLDAYRLAARFFPPAEAQFVARVREPSAQRARFTRLWVRKEAWVKGIGGRLTQAMAVPVHGPGELDGCGKRDGPEELPGPGELVGTPPCRVRDLPAPAGFHAAVALAGADPFRVTCRWWHPPR